MRVLSVRLRTWIMVLILAFPLLVISACGSGATPSGSGTGNPSSTTPSITAIAAQAGAQVITIANRLSGASVYYTVDGSSPTINSIQYLAPFLITQTTTVNAVAFSATAQSSVATQTYAMTIPSGTLVWSDEFSNATGANTQPNPALWMYEAGATGYGNQELEDYCAWGSNTSPCAINNPNLYVGTDGYLHIVAEQPSAGAYTSARIKTQGLFSVPYGRIEARMLLPEGQGLWPAFWLLGNNITSDGWPICGEMDVMEHTNSPSPDYILGSVHMPNANLSRQFSSSGFSSAGWHTYGMIWTKGMIEYYVDSPANIYATYSAAQIAASGGIWPFDSGNDYFVILNLAVGGTFPGSPNSSTPFPSQVLVDYVRLYTN